MKNKLRSDELHVLSKESCKKALDIIIWPLYFAGAHLYDGFCYTVSNMLPYFQALIFMILFLSVLSIILIFLHDLAEGKWKWDLMGLEEFKGQNGSKHVPAWRILKRFKRWTTTSGKGVAFWVGSIIIGPPVITPLIREKNNWKCNFKYAVPGSILSMSVWVTAWSGVGTITWKQYIVPLADSLLGGR